MVISYQSSAAACITSTAPSSELTSLLSMLLAIVLDLQGKPQQLAHSANGI